MIRFFSKLLILLMLLFFACKKENNSITQRSNNQDTISKATLENPMLIKFKNKVFGLPSPILVSTLVKKMNLPYDPSLINSTDNAAKYLTSFKQAVNIGIYSADLAYLNIYDQVNLFGQYFNIIKKLAQSLDLLNVINQETLNRIEQNTENADSLIFLVSSVFRDIDVYLTENEQQKIGSLILAGGWVESVYFLTQLYKQNPSDQLLLRIGEQKSPLNNLLHILEPYYNQQDKEIDSLFEALAEIASYYDAIEMEYKYEQSEVYPEKNFTIIHSKTIVNIDNLDLEKIIEKVRTLRYWLIN